MDKANLGQYGVYQVAAVLCAKGYTAVTTSRNTKAVDVLAFNPKNGISVGIQVKAGQQNGKTDIKKVPLPLITTVPDRINTLQILAPYVFVYVPDDPKDKPRFFIVTKDKVQELIKEEWEWYVNERKHRKPIQEIAKEKQPLKIWLEDLEPYENKWENLDLGPIKTPSPVKGEGSC